MANKSVWEDDPHLHKSDQQGKDWLEYLALTTDYLSIPICLLALLADLLLIIVIFRYRRLRNRTNYFLANFATFHTFYIISTPLFYIILDTLYPNGIEIKWYCTWTRVENFAMALLLTFIAGFGLDAVIEEVKPSWFAKYDKRYFYVFGFFYFLHILIYIISACICFKDGLNNGFNFYFLTIYYLLIVVLLLYLGIYNKDGRYVKIKAYALNISILILLIWLPLFVCYHLIDIVKNKSFEFALWYMAFMPEYLAYFSSFVVVYKLWKSNKQFRTAFKKIFKRQVSMSDYEELFVDPNKSNES